MIELHPVTGLPEVTPGDDLAGLLAERAELADGDILVVAQKVVSKAEGRLRDMREITPGSQALEIARQNGSDARQVQAVIDESVRLVRTERVIIAETRHGFVCANAGVDHSNVPGGEILCLLPVDPDASAAALRERLRELTGRTVAVIVSDTFGRAWRVGIQNVALGVAGMPAVVDYRGRDDDFGRTLIGTVVAIADELAGAAELAMGKTDRVPAVVIRGYRAEGAPGTGRQLVRPPAEDLFR
ncbi:MAG TPA: coenzyme F420-0:L-glutamate ligase [Candidatus Dormibacteraeota bacterium]